MVMALGLLVILTTLVNVFFAWFGSVVEDYTGNRTLISVLNLLALLGVITMANGFIYKVLPDVRIAWRDVWPGSLAATILMTLGGLILGLYFRMGGINSSFEAAGAFAILMIAIYYFAQIFLVGAIITRVHAHKRDLKEELA
jgi:membrane protein